MSNVGRARSRTRQYWGMVVAVVAVGGVLVAPVSAADAADRHATTSSLAAASEAVDFSGTWINMTSGEMRITQSGDQLAVTDPGTAGFRPTAATVRPDGTLTATAADGREWSGTVFPADADHPLIIQWDAIPWEYVAVDWWEKVWTGPMAYAFPGVWDMGGGWPVTVVDAGSPGLFTVTEGPTDTVNSVPAHATGPTKITVRHHGECSDWGHFTGPDDFSFADSKAGHCPWHRGLVSPPPSTTPATGHSVPQLVGLTKAGATSALAALTLRLVVAGSIVDPTCNQVGRVANQTPAAGSLLEGGGAVTVKLYGRPSAPASCP
jgi:hypothetical protein